MTPFHPSSINSNLCRPTYLEMLSCTHKAMKSLFHECPNQSSNRSLSYNQGVVTQQFTNLGLYLIVMTIMLEQMSKFDCANGHTNDCMIDRNNDMINNSMFYCDEPCDELLQVWPQWTSQLTIVCLIPRATKSDDWSKETCTVTSVDQQDWSTWFLQKQTIPTIYGNDDCQRTNKETTIN